MVYTGYVFWKKLLFQVINRVWKITDFGYNITRVRVLGTGQPYKFSGSLSVYKLQ